MTTDIAPLVIPLGVEAEHLACKLVNLTATYQSYLQDSVITEATRVALIDIACDRVAEMLGITINLAKALLKGEVKTTLGSASFELHLTAAQLELLGPA